MEKWKNSSTNFEPLY